MDASSTTRTLLIADDDPLVQATYKYCFEQAGYRVGIAVDGRGVLAFLQKNEVDTVFLDVFMPEKDGIETLLEIKKQFPSVRVIVMTGGGMSSRYDFLSAAAKFGADGVVKKPISPRDLVGMLQANTFQTVLG